MLCIDQPHLPLPCFPPCGFDAFFRDIKPGELASWKGLGHKVDSVTLTTPYVKHACAFLWLGDQPFDKLDYLVDKPCIKNSCCSFCLQLLELRVFRIGHASAFAGAFHHLALPSTFPIYAGSTWRGCRFQPRARQADGMLLRQVVFARSRVVLDHAYRYHCSEPAIPSHNTH